ncbi:hypothetical protein WSM22_14650 [Cytophagales bacterium WSM2-2]|nr:hypothetical protein WSM22_14650 [Cytophagales bacterium WSM2-2]
MDLKDSIFKFLRLDGLINSLSGYLETRFELLKMEVREEIVKVVAHGLTIGGSILLALLFLVFFSIGLASYISVSLGKSYAGYWIVSGGYALICLMVILFRKNIEDAIERYLKERAKNKGK